MSSSVLQHRRNKSSNLRQTDWKSQSKYCSKYPESLFLAAKRLYAKQEKMSEAMGLLQEYLQHRPDRSEAIYMFGVCLLHLGEPARAITTLSRLPDSFPHLPQAMLFMAIAHAKLANTERSLEVINQCIKKYALEEALLYRGRLHLLRHEYTLAERDFRQAASKPQATFMAAVSLADCYRLQSDFQRALQLYQQIAAKASTSQEQHNTSFKIAICFYYLENYEQASKVLTEICKKYPKSEVFYYLGQSQMKTQEQEKAIVSLEYSLRVHTNKASATKAMKSLILHYLETNQFYECVNVVFLGKVANIEAANWYDLVDLFMEIIRNQHDKSRPSLSRIYNLLKTQAWTRQQCECIYPIFLKFKAYNQFFLELFTQCIDTYDEYECYMKDVFGKESDVGYNKSLCEAILLMECDLLEEAEDRLTECSHLEPNKPQPFLYKVSLKIKRALTQNRMNQDSKVNTNILFETLPLFQQMPEQSIGLYLKSIVETLLQRYGESLDSIEEALKLSEQCEWPYLYMKGVLELVLNHSFEAIKEFTAGLLLADSAELYLGRCIAFLRLAQEKEKSGFQTGHSLGLQASCEKEKDSTRESALAHSLEDLHKFIQLSTDKDQINSWVIKVLFCHGAYEEVLQTLEHNSKDLVLLLECIEVYEGEFERGGVIGKCIQQAFDGTYIQLHPFEPIADQDMWLIILQLFVVEEYVTLTKYLQKMVFTHEHTQDLIHLKYNLIIAFLLTKEFKKCVSLAETLKQNACLKEKMQKIIGFSFEKDECLDDLRKDLGLRNKLLSSYLSYKAVELEGYKIYVKLSLPFPSFPLPDLNLMPTTDFLLEQTDYKKISKKIIPPWIKLKTGISQFTSCINENDSQLGVIE